MNKLLHHTTPLHLLILISTILCIAPASAQETPPESTHFYYGQQLSLEEISQIATHQLQETNTYIDCVHVTEPDDNPSIADYFQEFECFNTLSEARRFNQQLPSDDTRYEDSFEPLSDVELRTSCPYWAVYSQSFHIAWAGSICAGQATYVTAGIWSLWDAADNSIRLSDNPNHPGLRWTFNSTQYTLSVGPGGSRNAYHCDIPSC